MNDEKNTIISEDNEKEINVSPENAVVFSNDQILEKVHQIDTNTNDIDNINHEIDIINENIDGLASGGPRDVYDNKEAIIAGNPATGIYLAMDDGHIYYWMKDGTTVNDLGVYQATGVADNSIVYSKLGNDINKNFIPIYTPIETAETIDNSYLPNSVEYQLSSSESYKVVKASVIGIDKVFITTAFASSSIHDITFFSSENRRVGSGDVGPVRANNKEYSVPENASYCVLNYNKKHGSDIIPVISTVSYVVKMENSELYNISDELINRLSNKYFGELEKGYICFVADDGKSSAVTNTFPIVQEKNVPFTFACWTGSEIIVNATQRQQLIDLINNYNCAVCQHGGSSFVNMTKQALVEYLRNEKTKWKQLNINVNGLCYPNHEHNNEVMAICGSMFNVCATGGIKSDPLQYSKILYDFETNGARTNMYELYRVSSYSQSLDNLKNRVDYAYNNHKLLIIFVHDDSVINEYKTKLEDIIDYAKQVGITFTTINDLDKIK